MRRVLPYNLIRFMGITGTFLLCYIVVVGGLGNVDISGFLPMSMAKSMQEAWPTMPFFSVEKTPVQTGTTQEVFYTVPTRQITPQELTRMGVTNQVVHPAAPK